MKVTFDELSSRRVTVVRSITIYASSTLASIASVCIQRRKNIVSQPNFCSATIRLSPDLTVRTNAVAMDHH